MDNIFSLKIIPEGLDKAAQLPAVINKVGEAINHVNAAANPLGKIINILERIEKILLETGKVAVHSFNKLDEVLVEARTGFQKATERSQKLEESIGKIGKKSTQVGKDVKSGLLDNIAKIGQSFVGLQAMARTAAGLFTPIFEEGMARQNAVSDFETLLYGDRDAAEKLAKDIRSTDAAKLYGTSAINENVKMMLGYGVDTETSFQVTEALGDIAMGNKDKMNSLAMAFSQMSGLGVLQTQDWKQMVGAGFNPFNQMAKELGKSKDELNTMMSKGLITSDMVKDAFLHATQLSYKDKEGKTQYTYDAQEAQKNSADGTYEKGQFYGSAENSLKNTLSGRIANVKSGFDDLKAKLFELALPIAEKILPLITDHVFPLVEKLLPLVEKFTPVFEGIIAVLSMLADWIAANSEEVFTLAAGIGAIAAAVSIATSPVTLIVVALGALIYALVNVLKYWDEWGKYVVLICPPLALVMNLIQSIKRHWDSIVDGFTNGGILEGIKRIGLTILDAVLAPVENLLEMLAKIPGLGGIADWVRGGVSALREKINNALPEPKAEPYDRSKDPMVKEVDATLGTQAELETAVKPKTGNPAAALQTATDKGAESVASGGTRNTQITITLGNMVETVNFNGTPQDNAQETVDTFTSQLLRVLYSAQTAV